TASPDSRVVYVSSSAGNDSNSGLTSSAPKQTIASGYALLRDGFPDWLLLKSDDVWHENFPGWTKSGRSTTEPIRVGSYGPGERPTLYCGADHGFNSLAFSTSMAHLAITDMRLVGDGYDGVTTTPAGIELLANWSDVLVENCLIERFMTNLVFQSDPSTQVMGNIRIRRI